MKRYNKTEWIVAPVHRCTRCNALQYYKKSTCTACGGDEFTIVHSGIPRLAEDRGGIIGGLARIAAELPLVLTLILFLFCLSLVLIP